MAGLARSPTPGLVDYMEYTLKSLNLASAVLIRLRHHPRRSQLHSAGHEDSLLPGCRLPVLSLHRKGRSMTKRVSVSVFAGASWGLTLQINAASSSWTF